MKSYPFAASESEDEMKATNNIALPPTPTESKMARKSSSKAAPPPPPPSRKPEELKPPSPKQQPKGNVVLDKFGNFRLVEEPPPALPKDDPSLMDRKSRSRSKPRNYRSGSSRSRSRSSRGNAYSFISQTVVQ